jgi:hypothetical protein
MKATGRPRREFTILDSSVSFISDCPFVSMRVSEQKNEKGDAVAKMRSE